MREGPLGVAVGLAVRPDDLGDERAIAGVATRLGVSVREPALGPALDLEVPDGGNVEDRLPPIAAVRFFGLSDSLPESARGSHQDAPSASILAVRLHGGNGFSG